MTNEYYNPSGWPGTGSKVNSAPGRSEMMLINTGFDKLPEVTGNANSSIFVNSTGSALEVKDDVSARDLLGIEIGVDVQAYSDLLAALATLTNTDQEVPYFTSNTTASTLTLHDEDNMVSDDAAGIALASNVEAFLETQIATLDDLIIAPDGTRLLFYNSSSPTGWVTQTGYDNRLVFIRDSGSGGTFGDTAFAPTITSASGGSHAHAFTATGTTDTGASSTVDISTGSNEVPLDDHTHDFNPAETDTDNDTAHTHVTAISGQYAIVSERNIP